MQSDILEKSGDESQAEKDLLTKALGNPEKGGRVRGFPDHTTHRSVFGKTKRAPRTRGVQAQVDELAAQNARIQAQNAELRAAQEAQAEMIRALTAAFMSGCYLINF